MSTASTVAAGLRAARSPAVAAPGRRVQAHRNRLRPPLNPASTSTETFACIGLLAMIQACRPGRVSPPPPRRPLWTSLRSLPIPTVGKGSGKFPCQRDLASATHASTALLKFISPPGDVPSAPDAPLIAVRPVTRRKCQAPLARPARRLRECHVGLPCEVCPALVRPKARQTCISSGSGVASA
jgi:hypothetical protein